MDEEQNLMSESVNSGEIAGTEQAADNISAETSPPSSVVDNISADGCSTVTSTAPETSTSGTCEPSTERQISSSIVDTGTSSKLVDSALNTANNCNTSTPSIVADTTSSETKTATTEAESVYTKAETVSANASSTLDIADTGSSEADTSSSGLESTSAVVKSSSVADSASTILDNLSKGADGPVQVFGTQNSGSLSERVIEEQEKTEDVQAKEINLEKSVNESEDLTGKETEPEKSVSDTTDSVKELSNQTDQKDLIESDKTVTVEDANGERGTTMEEKDSLSEIPVSDAIMSDVNMEKEHPVQDQINSSSSAPKNKSYENEFQKFLAHPSDEPNASDNDSRSSDAKGQARPEIKTTTEDFKKFNAISSEETSNSSWYKMPENKEETMDVAETGLLGDENSNMSVAENASVVSSNIGDNSCQSFPVDESSNLSIPDDGGSVLAFAGHQPVFDESANMNPPSNVTFVQPDTPTSVNADTTSESTPTSKRNRRGTLQLAAEEANEQGHNITAADIYEYQWPQENDADWFMLQEQVSVYLDVKSFKRKYPEIFRRVCDKIEKDFLREKGVVTETQSDLGLTALKSEDVHDLMSRDYPAKYKEFLKILHEREKKRIAEKMKEYDAPRLEKEKMIEYTKRAMKSASDWNKKMLKERNKERRAYFDMQTFAIHYPKNKFRKLQNVPSVKTAYPITLIPGQFQEYYKKYSPEQLKHFPLNTTVIQARKMDPIARLQEQIVRRQKQQLALQQTVIVQRSVPIQEPKRTGSGSESDSDGDSCSGNSLAGSDNEGQKKGGKREGKAEDKKIEKLKKKEKSSSREASKEKSVEPLIIKKELVECRICKDEKNKRKIPDGEGLITCSECHRAGHPSCLDLTDEMVKVIKTYPWQCMECKTCVQCMDPYDEDKMLFCDNCDRGYHTFCVGLRSLPTGKWECKSCTGDTTPIIPLPRPPPKSKRGRKPKDPNAQSTPAKVQKDKDSSVRQTPSRLIPRREARDQDKMSGKDTRDTK